MFIMRIRPYRRLDNVIGGVVVTFMDITDRKQLEAERALRSEMVVSSGDAIMGLDVNGVITSWNTSAEALFGYTAAEALGKEMALIVPANICDQQQEMFARIGRGETIPPYDTVRRRKDGTTVDVSLRVSPIRDAAGTLIGVSKIARDISDRVRAERARDEIEARQELLVQELNHRVKNTLATVQSIASQTLREGLDPKAFHEAFQKRLAAISRTHNLLSEGGWEGLPLRDVLLTETAPYADGDADRAPSMART